MTIHLRRPAPALAAVVALCLALPGLASAGGPTAAVPATVSTTTDRLIVRLRDAALPPAVAAQRVDQVAGRLGASMRHLRAMSGRSQVVQLSRPHSVAEAQALARLVAADPAVEFAEPDLRMVPLRTPSDPSYASQWDLYEGAGGINAPAAWDRTTGSASITVAVVDTGILPHADLAGRTVAGYDFISSNAIALDGDGRDADARDPGDYGCNGSGNSSWHGTHVAGTVGAAAGNGLGIAGINWVSKVQPVRVLGRCGGYTSDIADGMRWAAGISVAGVPANATPSRVINLSLGASGACGTTFQNAINDVVARGTVVVVAAGNSGVDVSQASPASCKGVIAVGATTRTGARASYSNYGAGLTVSAPGNSILSTIDAGATTPSADSYAYYSGTSMATPHVTGVVSLMLSLNPALTPAQVATMLRGSARAFPSGTGADCTTALCGAGIVDAGAALNAAVPVAPPPGQRTNWALVSNGAVFSASSTYAANFPPSGAGDGNRTGINWGLGGGWNDSSPNTFPDVLEVNFGNAKQVAEIDVYTVQDNSTSPVEPTDTMVFTKYGITDFDVQYWDGAAWVTVSGGHVTGNNRVVRRFAFTPVTTSRVRVVVNGTTSGSTGITELEVWNQPTTAPTPVNVAAAVNGGVASASSTYSSYPYSYSAKSVINGERAGVNWGADGGWIDGTQGAVPDVMQIAFGASRSITEIDVFMVQDDWASPQAPTPTMTFSRYGVTAFEVQAWDGRAWITVPGGSITGNTLVWRKIIFAPLTTDAIRVVVTGNVDGYSRFTEIEAWSAP